MALNVLTYSVEDKQESITGASRIQAKLLLSPRFVTKSLDKRLNLM
jgi:hypothetical protein